LRVRFPDGQIAHSIEISAIALPSTSITLPAHVFADDTLQQSLFDFSDITNRDYDATFRNDGLYLYNADNELIYYRPKSWDAPSWTLPIQSPIAQASTVLSLPSNNKFVQLLYASLGSPVISTLLRALRKGYFATIPRFTSALLCKHKPTNSVTSALSHLDRRR
jgi:hypothetical protein